MRPASRRRWSGCWQIRRMAAPAPRPAASRRGCSRGRRARRRCWRRTARPSPRRTAPLMAGPVLRIGVDAREMHRRCDRRRALPRRAAAALDRPARCGRSESSSCSSRRPPSLASSASARRTCACCPLPTPARGGSRRRCARAARREPLDVFFAPAYTAPLGLHVPLALTIHDVSFLAHPEWFRPRERMRRRWLTRRSARAASVVFTDSAFSRDEILRHIPLDPGPGRGDCARASARGIDGHARAGAGAAGALRRLGVQSAPPAPAHCRVRARHGRARRSAAGDRRLESHLAAAGSRVDRGGSRRRRAGRGSQLRGRRGARDPLQPRVDIRVPLRVRRIRVDAARSARRRRAHSSCSIRRWRARSTAPAATYVAAGGRRGAHGRAPPRGARRQRRNRRDPASRRAAVLQRYSWDDAADADAGGHRTHGATAVTMTPPKLSIVIVSFNTRADLERCLESLTTQPAGHPSRDHRRGQRVERRQRRGGAAALAGREGRRARQQRRIRRRQQRSASGRRRERCCCCSTATASCRPARSTGWSNACARTPTRPSRARGWSTAPAATELSFGRMISPLGGAAAEGDRHGLRPRAWRRPCAGWIGATSQRAVRGLGQRRGAARLPQPTRRRRACSTSATSSTRRTSTSAPLSAPAAGGAVHAGGDDHPPARPLAGDGARGDERRLPPQPARLLRKAPSVAGRRCCACYLRVKRTAPD